MGRTGRTVSCALMHECHGKASRSRRLRWHSGPRAACQLSLVSFAHSTGLSAPATSARWPPSDSITRPSLRHRFRECSEFCGSRLARHHVNQCDRGDSLAGLQGPDIPARVSQLRQLWLSRHEVCRRPPCYISEWRDNFKIAIFRLINISQSAGHRRASVIAPCHGDSMWKFWLITTVIKPVPAVRLSVRQIRSCRSIHDAFNLAYSRLISIARF